MFDLFRDVETSCHYYHKLCVPILRIKRTVSAFDLIEQNYIFILLEISKTVMNGGHGTCAEVPANVSGKQLHPSNCPVQYVPNN